MNKEELFFTLFSQQKQFEEEKPTLEREIVPKVLDLMKLNLPLIVTGVRRCGKSYLLRIIKEELELNEKEYLYINFNDDRFVNFEAEDFQKIIDFLNEQKYKEKCFLFIDEIQEVNNWEKWVDRIKENYHIIITGSNSKLLSSEISTILTGRSLNIWLTPLSFREFVKARKVNLKDWKVTDNSGTQRTISTSNRDLDPGQYAVLAKAANVFTLWSIPSEALKIQLGEIFGNGLANAGDIVILYDSDGNEIDRMSWGTTLIGFTPNCIVNCQIVSEGHSLQRITSGSDSDTDSDFTDTQPPTPGN